MLVFKESLAMADAQTLGKAYHVIISSLVETGQAPHYSGLARALGCSIEEGRQIVHYLARAPGSMIRLNPDTDWIATFTHFRSYPLHSRSPWTVSRNGSAFEDRMRWRSAGCFRVKSLV